MAVQLKNIRNIAEALFPYNCGVVTPGNEALFRVMSELLPFKIFRFKSGSEFNGWVVPKSWHVKRAEVRANGKLLFDGMKHPLGVAALSKSFRGKLSWRQLKPHIHTRPDVPNANGYHCMWQYRPWAADWCLCPPHSEVRKWPKNGRYEVNLETESKPGSMLVAEYHIQGRSDQTIVINAHTCHPMQANDDILGMAVAITLFQELRKRKNRYSYRLVLGPEHLGTVFYLSRMSERERKKIIGGYFLEMPGTKYPIKVASSFHGTSLVDYAIHHVCKKELKNYSPVSWRQGAGNDETVWEAPGYEIPFVEVSRCKATFDPFKEYHTSGDNLQKVNWKNAKKFYLLIKNTLNLLEKAEFYKCNIKGLPCLSNPKFNLYIERPDPSVRKRDLKNDQKWGILADSILRLMDGKTPLFKISDRFGLRKASIKKYIDKLDKKQIASHVKLSQLR